MTSFNFEIAEKEFYRRYSENAGKEIDNSKLPAHSPMYYYCRGCCTSVGIYPELHWTSPPRYCDACQILANHGMMDRLHRAAKEPKPSPSKDFYSKLREQFATGDHTGTSSDEYGNIEA